MPHSCFTLATCFTHNSVFMSVLLSQLFCPLHHCVHMSVSLYLPCKQAYLSCLSRVHTYALMCDICFSLTYFTLYDRLYVHPFTSLQMTQFHSFLWLSNIPLYMCTTLSLPTDGQLDFFHVLAIINSASVNTGVHVSFWIIVFSGYVPRRR